MLLRRRPYSRTERPDMPVDEPPPAGSTRARLELQSIRALLDAQRRRVTRYAERYGAPAPDTVPPAPQA
ncbi:serine/threonine-protein phosphatase, partial [Streptomyces sp. SID2563]|nr:serine/threonine-protein phosphatase [Streptomyces sp. SID2563]